MEALVLDTNFVAVTVLDNFKSFIWTDRYQECGDFELYLVMTNDLVNIIKKDYYLWMKDSTHVMIIEEIEVTSDVEDGTFMIVTGRSLESILDRRIVWNQTSVTGNLENAVKKLLTDAIISPAIADRKIGNFIFEESNDPYINSLTLNAQYTGDTIYDVIRDICKASQIGFQIRLTDDNKFAFKLYSGEDRSYEQEENPYVVFSPSYDNIINSNYLNSNTNFKNVTLVAGQGEGAERKTTIVGVASGLTRREYYTDARDISLKDNEGNDIPEADYQKKLVQRGTEKLSERIINILFEGEMETTKMFKYGEHFFMGDIVEIEDKYGHEERAYISEFIFSQDEGGISRYPTFVTL